MERKTGRCRPVQPPPHRLARSRTSHLGPPRHQGQQITHIRRADEIFGVLAEKDADSARGRSPRCPESGVPNAHQLRADRQHDGLPRRQGRCRRRAAGGEPPARHDASASPPRTAPTAPARKFDLPTKSATQALAGASYSSVGEPCCTIRPPRSMQIVSLIDNASSWSWVTRTKVMPTSRCRFCSSICISRRSLRSSAASGSSSSSTVGRLTSARASATRCCWPPDSSQTGDRRSRAAARARASPRPAAELRPVGPRRALPQPVGDVGRDIEMREQRVVLEHHVHRPSVGRHAQHRLATDAHVAGARLLEARDQAQRRGLAAARRPEKGEERAAPDPRSTSSTATTSPNRLPTPANSMSRSGTASVTLRSR